MCSFPEARRRRDLRVLRAFLTMHLLRIMADSGSISETVRALEKEKKAKFEQREVIVLPPNVSGKKCKTFKQIKNKVLLKSCNKAQRQNNPKDAELKYQDQLNDPRWFAFRQFIFTGRGCKCEICGSDIVLQVHHPHYISGRKAWEYACNEVVVLCKDCHSKMHPEHHILQDSQQA